jgi:adenosylhomocysteine nucleosidase
MLTEASCLGAAAENSDLDRPLIYCAGASADRALEGARQLVESGVAGLVSFGIAGGLDPGLAVGDLVVADAVIDPDGRSFATASSWCQAIRSALGDTFPVRTGPLAGAGDVIAAPADKARLFQATQAIAVDMESHAVATAAEEAGLPFLILRAVADPAHRAIPQSARVGLAPDGGTRPFAVIGKLLVRPWEAPAVWMLARDNRAALDSLRRVAPLALAVGPTL